MLRQISRGLVCCVAALMVLGVSDAFAQGNPNAPGQQKKRANQVPDTGLDDTAAPAELAVDRTMNLPVVHHNERNFRWALNEDAMATEKLAEGIRAFAVDSRKLDALIESQRQ